MKNNVDFIEPTTKYTIGDLVRYPVSKALPSIIKPTLCIVVEIRQGYYRLQCTKTQRYHNTTEKWLALPTYYPTPMGLPKSP
jgi:hypothetical protein